jgi:hypothetical protein
VGLNSLKSLNLTNVNPNNNKNNKNNKKNNNKVKSKPLELRSRVKFLSMEKQPFGVVLCPKSTENGQIKKNKNAFYFQENMDKA